MAEPLPRIRVTDPNLASHGPLSPAASAGAPSTSDPAAPRESLSSSPTKPPFTQHHRRQQSSTDTAKAAWRALVTDRGPPLSSDGLSDRPMSARSMDPISQAIYDRVGMASSASPIKKAETSDQTAAGAGITPIPSHESGRSGASPSPDPSTGHSRDRKSGTGFFSRIMGNKKKEDGDTSNAASSEGGADERPEGAEAEAFYQPVDNMGFSPKHPQPPPYIKIRSKYKKDREFNRVFLAQRLAGAEATGRRRESIMNGRTARRSSLVEQKDAIWAMEVSKDGRYLAAAGQDKVVRVWSLLSTPRDRREFEKGEEANMAAPGQIHLSAPVFKQDPIQTYEGHEGAILDLSWSKNNFLLSSSMDKTVRLWHISRKECLCAFKHSDFVTSIQFHPKDDRFFLAGSLDSKLRLWSIPDKTVAYGSQMSEMITAVAFTPDGKTAIAGCLNGACQFHETEGLRYLTQLHVKSRTGKNAKGSKITGIQAMNFGSVKGSRDIKLLITSNDSRIRLYNMRDRSLEMKFKGNENTSSQIRARITDDGKYVICGSEDNKVYIWSTTPSDAEKKDKWPVEIFEAHLAAVTSCVFMPTRSRQLLSASEDPLYDICNPPPVTLMSRSEANETKDSPDEEVSPKSPTLKSKSHSSGSGSPPAPPSANPAYLSRTNHPDGNIILTADDTGTIKVFRQDCAWLQRMRSDLNSETSSLKRASSALIRRSNSMATTRSNTSASGLARQGSTASNATASRDRILSWRQSIGGSSTHSVDKTPNSTSSRTPNPAASSPALSQHRQHLRTASPRLSLSGIMRRGGGGGGGPHATNGMPATSSPGGADDTASPATSERSSVREKPSLSAPGLGAAASAAGPALTTIPSQRDRETSASPARTPELHVVDSHGNEAEAEREAENEAPQRPGLRQVASSAYWTGQAWQDEIKEQLAAPRRQMSASPSARGSSSRGPSSRGSTESVRGVGGSNGAANGAGAGHAGAGDESRGGGLAPPRGAALEKSLSGWSTMTIAREERAD